MDYIFRLSYMDSFTSIYRRADLLQQRREKKRMEKQEPPKQVSLILFNHSHLGIICL